MPLDSLRNLLVDELKDLYSAESQLVKALPRMAKAATAPALKAAFTEHLAITRGQVGRLDEVFADLGAKARGKKCKAMEGLIEEFAELLEEKADADPAVFDAALIGAAQKVEHYEIAGYGTARTLARQLGLGETEALLQATLDEEGEADKRLTALAEEAVNPEAAGAEADEDEELDEDSEDGENADADEPEEEPAPAKKPARASKKK